jgi:hypothetical protein
MGRRRPSMTAVGKKLVVAACVLVLAGCGFLRKDRARDAETAPADVTQGNSGQPDVGVEPTAEVFPPAVEDAKGSAAFDIKRQGDVPEGYGLVPGSYTMNLSQASIVSGTVGGLSVAFESLDEKKQEQSLGMLLPSGKVMSVWLTYEGGRENLHFMHPHLPFKLTDGNYPSDPQDARGHGLAIGPIVTHKVRQPNGILSPRFVHFEKFKIEVTDAAIDDMKLTMSCTFEGESVPYEYEPPAVYSISGSFTITGAVLGHTFRD